MTVDPQRVQSCLAVAQEHLDDPLIAQKVEQLMVAVMLAHSDDVKTFEDQMARLIAEEEEEEDAWLDEWDDEDEEDSDEP